MAAKRAWILRSAILCLIFLLLFLLSWVTLPVSKVIKSFGEAQSRLGGGRRGAVGPALSLAEDPSLSPPPGPRGLSPFLHLLFHADTGKHSRSVCCVPGTPHVFVAAQTLSCPRGAHTQEGRSQ